MDPRGLSRVSRRLVGRSHLAVVPPGELLQESLYVAMAIGRISTIFGGAAWGGVPRLLARVPQTPCENATGI